MGEAGNTMEIVFIFLVTSFSRLLFLSNTDVGDIAKYDLKTKNLSDFSTNNNFPSHVIVDVRNQVIYWSALDDNTGSYELMKTYYNMTTKVVKTYNPPISGIVIAQSVKYLYVLHSTKSEIEKIDKKTEQLLETFNVQTSSQQITVANGKNMSRAKSLGINLHKSYCLWV